MHLKEFSELWVSFRCCTTATKEDKLEPGVSHSQVIKIWPIHFFFLGGVY